MRDIRDSDRVRSARRRNSERSRSEQGHGWASPESGPVVVHFATAVSALECALECEDWDVVAEAFCVLDDALTRLRGPRKPPTT